jgi:hypothetical protein
LNFGLSGLVVQFTHDGVEEVDTTKGTCHDWIDLVTNSLDADLCTATDMRENIALAQLDESEFGVVGVGRVIFETMACGTEEAQGLVELLLVSASVERSAEIDAATEEVADQLCRRGNAQIFRGDVVLQAGSLIDAQLPLFIDRGTQSAVVLTGIFVVSVVFGVVDMLLKVQLAEFCGRLDTTSAYLGAVATKSLGGDLEFASTIAKGQETEDP